MFVKCWARSNIEGNILQTKRQKFLMVIDTPVTICFAIPQNQNKIFFKKSFKQKKTDDFNVARSTMRAH